MIKSRIKPPWDSHAADPPPASIPLLKIAARIILGLVFAYAAWTKLRVPWLLFAISVESYQILPEQAVLIVARVLPWVELGLGVLLVAGMGLPVVAPLSTTMLIVFFAGMIRAYVKNLGIDCGCFGVGETLGPATLARDAALLALSIALTWMSLRYHSSPRDPAPAGDLRPNRS